MFCSLCNKKTQHPNNKYCRNCKKKIKNIKLLTIKEIETIRLRYLQEKQRLNDEAILQDKILKSFCPFDTSVQCSNNHLCGPCETRIKER